MIVKITALVILTMLIMAPLQTVYAGTEANVLQAYVDEQIITVITDTPLNADMLTCKISNQYAEIKGSGTFSSEDALIRTTLLIDISTSMPKATHEVLISVLNRMVEGKSTNEEFKVVTFGENLVTLQDFTSDRFDLSAAINKIEFDNRETQIFDAIYNTMPSLMPLDGKAVFYRTVVFSDGIDDATLGVTREELYIKLQNELYPVDIAAVNKDETAEDKDLSAIVRMSGGRYFMLNPGSDVDKLAQSLKPGDYFWFAATIPGTLLDGTTRQVDIYDGIYNFSFDLKFPVFTIMDEPESVDEPPATEPPTPTPEMEPPSPVEIDEPEPPEMILGKYTITIFIAMGVVSTAIIATIIIVLVTRSKREKQEMQKKKNAPECDRDPPGAAPTDYYDESEVLQYTIKLSTINNPGEKPWNLPVDEDILIGRAEDCDVRLDDTSVSREHCKIIARSEGLIVVHLSKTNKTYLNGSNIINHAPLQTGDKLKIGRETLRVDNIQASRNQPKKPERPPDLKGKGTKLIWDVYKQD